MKRGVVLVVEDDPDAREILRMALEMRLGVRVVLVEDRREAVRRAKAVKPAVVVLDIVLPGRSGLEVARQMKGNEATQDIPVIGMTASSVSYEEAIEAGCDEYLPKPFVLDHFLKKVRKYLRDGASGE